MDRLISRAWAAMMAVSAASGVYFLLVLARLPSDGGLLRFSPRLVIVGGMGLLVLGFLAAGGLLLFHAGFRARWLRLVRGGRFLLAALALAGGLLLAPLTLLDLLYLLARASDTYVYTAFAARLEPLADWLALVGLLLALLAAGLHRRDLFRALDAPHSSGAGTVYRAWGWFWLALALLAAGLALTRLGFTVDTIGSWGLPTTPLLEWQIALALLVTLVAALLLAHLGDTRWPARRVDWLLALGVWALAALLWTTHPLIPGYFATAGRPPNFEIYPFSDGAFYDQYAQSILIGNGFMGGIIPQRPLYAAILVWLHLLAGQDYLRVIFVQSLLLAVFPLLLFWLGRELHSRPAGLLAALLAILREITAMRVAPFSDNISYSKLYFSELPTAIFLCAFTLMALRWVRSRSPWLALAAGGCVGLAMLIRTQSMAVLPAALLPAIIAFRRPLSSMRDQPSDSRRPHLWDWRGWLAGATLMLAGALLCVAPWTARNWSVAGGFALDNADTQTSVLAGRYNNMTFGQTFPRGPGESESHYSSRLLGIALQGMARDPAETARLILNHFANNEIDNVFIFPIRLALHQPGELIWPASAFWQTWAGRLTAPQLLLLLANLGLLAAGLAASVAPVPRTGANWRMAGWIPLLVNLAYNFSTSVFRSSGDRFLLPADWPFVLYYALGWAQILVWGWALLGRRLPAGWGLVTVDAANAGANPGVVHAAAPRPRRLPGAVRLLAVALLILLAGAALPVTEHAFPARYPTETRAQLAADFSESLAPVGAASADASALIEQANRPDAVLLRGRALYPRYYAQGEVEPKTAKPGYASPPIARLVFYLVGSQNGLIVLPLTNPPSLFPNTADVLVLGCPAEGYTTARAVIVDGKVLYQSAGACQ